MSDLWIQAVRDSVDQRPEPLVRAASEPETPQICLAFNSHGLGDCVHAAIAMRLYVKRGYDVAIQVEPNKRWIWESAGIPIYDGPEQLPIHPYYYPDMNKFWDLAESDHLYSKIAHFFEIAELPKLGTKEEIWRMVCEERFDPLPFISGEAHAEAEAFLKDMPRPIFVLHSKGTNWQAEKSIPDDVAFNTIRGLLDNTHGSVIVLDYDCRAPMIGDVRCKGIKPNWGHIGVDRLCALLQRTDLFVGVDSGPFHVASLMSQVKCLGVFRKIPAVRCCIPSPNATYLSPAKDHEHWATRGSEWKFLEYPMAEVTATDIVTTAIRLAYPEETVDVSEIVPQTVPGRYTYRRVGHDERALELLPDGKIGEGAAGCERAWKIEQRPTSQVLTIFGEHGGPTCHLDRHSDGVFHGRWLHNERMPIELIPGNSVREVAETVGWNDLVAMTESPTPAGHVSDRRLDAPVEFYVSIATLNCFDLAELCIEAILRSTWLPRRIYVIDNSGGKFPGHQSKRVQVFTPTHNLGAGGTANFILPAIHPAPAILINDDIEVAPDTLESMVKQPHPVVVADGTSAFTAVLIREEAWKKVGIFDPVFWPAYCEDADWQYRAELLGIRVVCPRSGGFKENGPSATRQRMSDAEREQLNRHYDASKAYYIRKWGGPPRLEVFKSPFNGVPQS